MAQLHGANTATAATQAVGNGVAKVMNGAMTNMSKMSEATHAAMKSAATGVVASAGKRTLKKVLSHPITLIGIGFALGYLAYKFRHDIISEESAAE